MGAGDLAPEFEKSGLFQVLIVMVALIGSSRS